MFKYSLILPAYKAKFLGQAIESILNQTYSDFELIVIDDASPEDLQSVVSQFADSRLKYFRNAENIGGKSLVEQWNHCLQYASGDFTILAADDDLYSPKFLEEINQLIVKYPTVNLVRSRVEVIDESNNLIGMDGVTPEFTSKYEYLYYWLQATVFTCIGNYVFRTNVLKDRKFIDFPFAFGSDTASTINMSDNGVANTSEMLFKFRISSIHLSSSKDKLIKKLEANNQLFEWFRKLNYEKPTQPIDLYCFNNTQWDTFYQKYKYDCYNLVIKYLPMSKLSTIRVCRLLTRKDRMVMLIRYLKDKLV